MALLDDLATYLASQGLGTVNVDITKGGFNAGGPEPQLTMVHSGGLPPVQFLDDEAHEDRPTVQISVRCGTDDDAGLIAYRDAEARASEAYRAIYGLAGQTIGTTRVIDSVPTQTPFFLQWDQNERAVFVFNVLLEVIQ